MPHFGVQQVVGYHGIEHGAGQADATGAQHLQVILHVLAYLQRFGIFQNGLELPCHAAWVIAHRHIPGFSLSDGKAHAHQCGAHGIGVGGLGVDAEFGCRGQRLDESGTLLGCIHQVVLCTGVLPGVHAAALSGGCKEVALRV